RAGGSFCNFVAQRVAGSNALIVFDSYTNIATERVRGLDFTVRWVKEIGPGTLRINGILTDYLEQANKLFPEDPFDEFNGTLNTPKYAATLDTTYTYHSWKVRYGLEWLSSMQSYDLFGLDKATTQFVLDVPNYYLHNISVQYRGDTWEATAGINNIADREPPKISSGISLYSRVGNAPLYSGYDYFGRTFFVNVTKRF
ncbi:MAG TPA: TonB-dependent receptor, partial [Caulobacteraceae bacterium]|nr:TonB-dependent receptor [Caulobacteraceae bacterium]